MRERGEVLAGLGALEDAVDLRLGLLLGRLVGARVDQQQDVAGADGLGALEPVGILVVEVLGLGVGRLGRVGHLRVHHLGDRDLRAGVGLEAFERHLALGERLLERVLVARRLLHRVELFLDFRIGGGEVARLGFLLEQRVGDELVEHLAIDLVAALGGDGSTVVELDVAQEALEIGLGDVLAVDVRQHARQGRRHRLGGSVRSGIGMVAGGVAAAWCAGRRRGRRGRSSR